MTTVRISLGGDSFYLHCLVYRNIVGLRARFGAPLTGLNSPVVIIMLLTVPRRRPTVFLRCMSMLFHTVLVTLLLVSLVVFSSTTTYEIFIFIPLNGNKYCIYRKKLNILYILVYSYQRKIKMFRKNINDI
jgi:hypothetical protein